MVQYLKDNVGLPGGINVIPMSSQFMLNTICETAMGVKLDSTEESREYKKSIYELATYLVYRFMRPMLHNMIVWKLLGYQGKLEKLLKPVHSFTRKIIQQRREEFHENQSNKASELINSFEIDENLYMTKKRRYAMLDTLLAAETKGLIDSEGIREEVDTFTFEGHDTTSTALSFILLILANHPEVQEKILEELHEIESDAITINDLSNLKYLDRVIKESLRLYPPVPYISRALTEDVSIGKK